jgi:eukaryotic translation initiation factor 2C
METHNIAIQPSTLGVKIGQTTIVPITCCRTVEQFYKVCRLLEQPNAFTQEVQNRASPEVIRAALEFTPPNPGARAAEIRKAFGHFDYRNSGFLVNAGINVDQTPQTTRGRFLERPSIIFNKGSRKTLVRRSP